MKETLQMLKEYSWEIIIVAAFIIVAQAVGFAILRSLTLIRSEKLLRKILRIYCEEHKEMFDLIDELKNNTIRESDLLKLELLAVEQIEKMSLVLDVDQRKSLIGASTQQNKDSKKAFLKKLYNFDTFILKKEAIDPVLS